MAFTFLSPCIGRGASGHSEVFTMSLLIVFFVEASMKDAGAKKKNRLIFINTISF
jgi:hypothetical protein